MSAFGIGLIARRILIAFNLIQHTLNELSVQTKS